MSMGQLIAEGFIQTELDFRKQRAMSQYNRHARRHPKRFLGFHRLPR